MRDAVGRSWPLAALLVLFALPVIPLLSGERISARLDRANALLEKGETGQAKAIYEDILEYQPATPDAVEGMASIASIHGATEEYRNWCAKLLQFRPWDREANLAAGRRHLENGNLGDAALRFILAYQNSDFQNDKSECLQLLQEVKNRIARTLQPGTTP